MCSARAAASRRRRVLPRSSTCSALSARPLRRARRSSRRRPATSRRQSRSPSETAQAARATLIVNEDELSPRSTRTSTGGRAQQEPLEAQSRTVFLGCSSHGHQRVGYSECCSFQPLLVLRWHGGFLSLRRLDERDRPGGGSIPGGGALHGGAPQHGEAHFELAKALRARQGGQQGRWCSLCWFCKNQHKQANQGCTDLGGTIRRRQRAVQIGPHMLRGPAGQLPTRLGHHASQEVLRPGLGFSARACPGA